MELKPIPIEFTEEPWNMNVERRLRQVDLLKVIYIYANKKDLVNEDENKIKIITPDNNIKKLFFLNESKRLYLNNILDNIVKLQDKSYIRKKEGWKLSRHKTYHIAYRRKAINYFLLLHRVFKDYTSDKFIIIHILEYFVDVIVRKN